MPKSSVAMLKDLFFGFPFGFGFGLALAWGRVCNWGHEVHINGGHCRDVAILSAATWRA